jgi:hypothetical protein
MVFVLLPPLWTIVAIIQRVFRKRTKAPARRNTTTLIAAATPEPEPSLAKTS